MTELTCTFCGKKDGVHAHPGHAPECDDAEMCRPRIILWMFGDCPDLMERFYPEWPAAVVLIPSWKN